MSEPSEQLLDEIAREQEWTNAGALLIATPTTWRFIVSNETQAIKLCTVHNDSIRTALSRVAATEDLTWRYRNDAKFYNFVERMYQLRLARYEEHLGKTPPATEQPSAETGEKHEKRLIAANHKQWFGHLCPWVNFEGKPGTFGYARSVYEWMESEFGVGHFIILDAAGWYYVQERATLLSSPTAESVDTKGDSPRRTEHGKGGVNLYTPVDTKGKEKCGKTPAAVEQQGAETGQSNFDWLRGCYDRLKSSHDNMRSALKNIANRNCWDEGGVNISRFASDALARSEALIHSDESESVDTKGKTWRDWATAGDEQ